MKPLVDAAWLQANRDRAVIADCRWYLGEPDRGRAAYLAGHIPGAVFVSLDGHLSADAGAGRHPLPLPSDFAAMLGRLGIGNDSTVVAYDDRGGAVAARLWWMLTAIGHETAVVLDGGLQAWTAAGGAVESAPVALPATDYTTEFIGWPGTTDRLHLRQRLGTATVIDARAAERYRGEREPVDPVAGHIPTATNVPYEGNLDASGRFLAPEQLADRFNGAGPDAVVYCGSGVTACHDLLAMEVAGIGRAVLYPGSWSDWSTAGEDVAAGPGG